MIKFLKYCISILLLSLCIFEIIIFSIIMGKKGVFHSSYQSVITDKYRMLQNTNDPKIIMISGSSSAFGLDQDMLEKHTGYKVVNLGLHAGFGSLFYSELAKENINQGDIVLLGYEYGWEKGFDSLGQDLIMTGIDENIDMYKHIPIHKWPDFIGYIFKYAEKKNNFEEASGLYSREAFDKKNAQMTWIRDFAMSDYSDKLDIYGTISVKDENGDVSISDSSIRYLKKLKKYIEDRGAKVFFVSSPILYESISCDVDDFLKLAELEEEKIGIPYISNPKLYMFPIDLMSNAVNHCNSEGERVRTGILIDDLYLSGVIEEPKESEVKKDECGETIALIDNLPERLLRRPQKINRVYQIKENGEVKLFEENIDYTIDYERGTIQRTVDSRIPNYREHKVSYSEGRFELVLDGNNINPQTNTEYQILVDYNYCLNENELNMITDQSFYLSDHLKDKFRNGEDISISLFGDSICDSYDSEQEGFFEQNLKKTLEKYFNCNIDINRLSSDGANVEQLINNKDFISGLHSDIIMIEVGMNDHSGDKKSSKENLKHFKKNLSHVVSEYKKQGIDVILFGFFQQNITWNKENMKMTTKYNKAIQNISEEENVYFADIYDIFDRVGNKKQLSRDVMADYVHRPTEWGNKLYFSSVIDAFNIDHKMSPDEIPNYICVEK